MNNRTTAIVPLQSCDMLPSRAPIAHQDACQFNPKTCANLTQTSVQVQHLTRAPALLCFACCPPCLVLLPFTWLRIALLATAGSGKTPPSFCFVLLCLALLSSLLCCALLCFALLSFALRSAWLSFASLYLADHLRTNRPLSGKLTFPASERILEERAIPSTARH